VALVEIRPSRWREPRDASHLREQRCHLATDDHAAPGALRTGRRTLDVEPARGEELTAARRELRRPLRRDDRALAQLAADRGDDRDRQVDRSREAARRHGLEAHDGGDHGADAALALREADGCGDLAHDL
jgi:hypothetical protein